MKSMYINWNVVKAQSLSQEEINEFLDTHDLKRTYPKQNAYMTYKVENIRGKYIVKTGYNDNVLIMGFDRKEGLFKITTQPNAGVRDELNITDKDGLGGKAAEQIEEDFKKLYNKTIDRAFHTVKYKNTAHEIKLCVPSPINWANSSGFWKNQIIAHVKKADVSSAYPTEMSKRLPTLEGHLRLDGRVEPNEEYPFAFYLKSQHIKIIEEDGTVVSTFDLAKNKQYMETPKKRCGATQINKFNEVAAEDDITILCKVSKYSFKPIMEYYYLNRHKNPWFKFVMNAFIGMLHSNKNPKLSYLAAVVLLRCSWNMAKRLQYLESKQCIPLLVNTDSIAWVGKDTSLTTTTKALGNFVMEHEDCEMIICSSKKYQLRDKGIVSTTWAGVKDVKELNLEFGDILKPEINKKYVPTGWKWDDEKSRYIKGVLLI